MSTVTTHRRLRRVSPLAAAALAWAFLLAAAPLAAQPELAHSTYLGAPFDDFAWDVTFDDAGNAYVVGCSEQPPVVGFPFAMPPGNAFDGGAGLGGDDAFVTKLSPEGAVIYSAILGGPGQDCARAVAVDAAGRAFITGSAGELFPLVEEIEGYQAAPEAFVAVLDPTGTQLELSTYLSGDDQEAGEDIALGADGAIYVTGTTGSTENTFVPTSPTFDDTFNGTVDGFLAKLDTQDVLGPRIVFKTFLGTAGTDRARALALDGDDNVFVVGLTDWPDKFHNAPDPLIQAMHGGGFDAFLLRINSGGFGSSFFTWLGGGAFDSAYDVALSGRGEILVAGTTGSDAFPTRRALQPVRAGDSDAFLARVSAAGNELLSSTYWGGFMFDDARALAVSPTDEPILVGFSDSANLPLTPDALQTVVAGFEDVFVTRFTPEVDDMVFSSWLGGGDFDLPRAAATFGERLALAGQTFSAGADPFPVTDDAVLRSPPTPFNGFFSVIDFGAGEPAGEIHPADANGDRRIGLDEITAYGAAWKTGSPWPTPPSPIPIDHLTNAAALWKQGEEYVDTGAPKPGGWQPAD